MADVDELEEDEYPPKPSKLPLIGGVLVAFLIGGGAGFGANMMLGSSDAMASGEETEEDGGTAEGEDGETKKKSKGGKDADSKRVITSLESYTVNLRGGHGGRVLRMEVQVEVDASDEEDVKAKIPLLRDAVLTLASDYSWPELEGLDGKTRLRDELLGRLNSVLDGPEVYRVYFTQFVVQ